MSRTETPLLSVVIPTCHRNDELARCLDRLAPGAQALDPAKYDVVVTDDGRASTAEQMVRDRFPWATWTLGPRNGIGTNRNNGARHSTGGWIVFIDSDTIPDPDCLKTYADAIEREPEAIAFEGAIHPQGDTTQEWCKCPVNMNGGVFWTANVAIRRDVFEKVGGFDPNYRGYNEDQDLYLRLLELGPVAFLEKSVVVHPVRNTSFMQDLRRMPTALHDWTYYVRKNGKALGQANLPAAVLSGLEYHTRTVWRGLRRRHFRKAALDMIWVAISVFVLPFYYLQMPRAEDRT